MRTDLEISEQTSIIMISCFELSLIGKFVSHSWRIFFDDQLSIVLTKLETIHEKLIRLNVVGRMKIKINWISIVVIFLNVTEIVAYTVWIIYHGHNYIINDMIIMWIANICKSVVLFEYILLILYTQWIVYKINDQIPERKSCLSTFRDMYLEVLECLNDVNKSIYGLPVIINCIAANTADILMNIYAHILFPRDHENQRLFAFPLIGILVKTTNILTLYMIGHATEKEINRMSLVLHQRSVVEKNPRIKRQIKIFLLRRVHEHFHFQLCGMYHINLKQLLILLNSAIGYLLIQILFKFIDLQCTLIRLLGLG
ncbi:hypothetical protein QTP88_015795 [Uroleucon formosanum]